MTYETRSSMEMRPPGEPIQFPYFFQQRNEGIQRVCRLCGATRSIFVEVAGRYICHLCFLDCWEAAIARRGPA